MASVPEHDQRNALRPREALARGQGDTESSGSAGLIVTSAFDGWRVLWGILHLAIAVAKGAPVWWARAAASVRSFPSSFFLGILALQCAAIALLRTPIDLPRIDAGRYEVNVWLDVDQDPTTETNRDYFSIRRRHERLEQHDVVPRNDGQTVVPELPFERTVIWRNQ